MGTKMSQGRTDLEYSGFDISALPEETFVHILLFVPGKDLVRSCSLVSKYWLQVCRYQSLWKRKCLLQKVYLPEMGPPPKDFIVLYFQNPYGRNLLQNTTADGCKFWNKMSKHPLVEQTPFGSHPIADSVPADEIQGRTIKNWVTSYTFSSMDQQIDLLNIGCSEFVLDELRPTIYASAWCSARYDCGSEFKMNVKLLAKDKTVIAEKTEEKSMVAADQRKLWHKVELTFTDYPPGLRKVHFCIGGVDTQFWAGDYGSKFTLPCLCFMFDE